MYIFIYIFAIFSNSYLYMHEYTITIFIDRYLIHMYTLMVYLKIFSPFSPTVIYSIYVFYINSEFT
jgi:hypothetical protein